MKKVRIDKWLWAARFFKTRSLAKQAIDRGRVYCNGQRVKPAKEVECGLTLTVRRGQDTREVEVIALSDQRRGAPEAVLLYRETAVSIEKREREALQRRLLKSTSGLQSDGRPTKKQRRQIHRFKDISQ